MNRSNYVSPGAILMLAIIGGAILIALPARIKSQAPAGEAHELPQPQVSADGQLTLSLSLAIPPATAGAGPELTLVYRSGRAQTIFGSGWDLEGLPAIERDGSATIRYDGADDYRVRGGERLLPIDGGAFKPRVDDGLFYKPTGVCGDGPCSWTAITPDGLRLFFGDSEESRLAGPAPFTSSIREWLLSRAEDRNGNYWTVEYEEDQGLLYPAIIRYTGNLVVGPTERSIRFEYQTRPDPELGYASGSRQDLRRRVRRISIRYGGDEIRSYEMLYSQDPDLQTSRLVGIQEYINGNARRTPLSFAYTVAPASYAGAETGPMDMGMGPPDMNVCNLGEVACLEATLHPANTLAVTACTAYVLGGADNRCRFGNTWTMGDVNGDGAADFIRAVPNYFFAAFLGTDKWQVQLLDGSPVGADQPMSAPLIPGEMGTSFFADMNGDGRADLVRVMITQLGPPTRYAFLVSPSNGSSFEGHYTLETAHGLGMGFDPDYFIKFLIKAYIDYILLPNMEKTVAGAERAQMWKSIEALGPVIAQGTTGEDAFGQFADMNGDGKLDYVRLLNPSTIGTVFSNGAAFTGDVHSTVDGGMHGQHGMRALADFNGDGIPDFCRLIGGGADIRLSVALGSADGRFAESYVSPPLDAGHRATRRMEDINGDGYADFFRLVGSGDVAAISFATGRALGASTSASIGGAFIEKVTLADVDGDGRLDLGRFIEIGPGAFQPQVQLFRGDRFSGSAVVLPALLTRDQMVSAATDFGDINGDGRADFISPGLDRMRIAQTPVARAGLLRTVSTGDGKTLTLRYSAMARISGAIATNRSVAANQSTLPDNTKTFAVTEVEIAGQSGPRIRRTFEYSGRRMKVGPTRRDTRSLGFERITQRDFVYSSGTWVQRPTYNTVDFYQNHPTLGYEGSGLPREQAKRYVSNGEIVQATRPVYGRPAGYRYANLVKIAQLSLEEADYSTNRVLISRQEALNFDTLGNAILIRETKDANSPASVTTTDISLEYPENQPAGRVRRKVISGSGRTLLVSEFEYDGNGNQVVIREGRNDAALVSRQLSYTPTGQLAAMETNGFRSEFEYDDEIYNFVVRADEPSQGVVEKEFDPATGRLLWHRDPHGVYTVHRYDDLGRLINTQRGTSTIALLTETLVSKEYIPEANGGLRIETREYFDGENELLSAVGYNEWGETVYTESQGAVQAVRSEKRYDAAGRLVAETLPQFAAAGAGPAVVFEYDALDRRTRQIVPHPGGDRVIELAPAELEMISFTSLGGATMSAYALRQQKPDGQIIYEYKTVGGQTIQTEYETEFASESSPGLSQRGWTRTRYHYSPNGDLKAITRGSGPTRTAITDDPRLSIFSEFDLFGRQIELRDPAKGVIQYTYDSRGLPACTIQSDGKSTCNEYDERGRLKYVRKENESGQVMVRLFYDESESLNGQHRLTRVQDDSGIRRFHYDLITGKVRRTTREYAVGLKLKEFDIVDDYSPSGLLVSRHFPTTNIRVVRQWYPDGTPRDIRIIDPDNHIAEGGNGVTVAEFAPPDAAGAIPSARYGNGVQLNYEYEAVSRNLIGILAESTAAGPIASYRYSHDAGGQLLQAEDRLQANGVDLSEEYSYDVAHRVISATGPYGAGANPRETLVYRYGADGQPRIFEGRSVDYGGHPHRLSQSGPIEYLYDYDVASTGAGNVVTRRDANGLTHFTYNESNRVKTMSAHHSGGNYTIDYKYDYEGNRFSKVTTDTGGLRKETFDLDEDYRIHTDGGQEVHVLSVFNDRSLLMTSSFNMLFHLAEGPTTSDSYRDRLADLLWNTLQTRELSQLANAPPLIYGYIRWQEGVLYKLYVLSVVFIILIAALWLRSLWRDREAIAAVYPGYSPLRLGFLRAGAIFCIVSFHGACLGGLQGNEDEFTPAHLLPFAAGQFVEGGADPDVTLGTFYYLGNQVHSNQYITDSVGRLVCRIVYRPFGQVNEALTDTDADKNGVHFLAERLYTGQELEAETGLYNYGARIYDQQTGRFLQPDPVHSERIGYDNSDRYLYVHSNPVNFHDPDGRAPEAGYEVRGPNRGWGSGGALRFDRQSLQPHHLWLAGLTTTDPVMRLAFWVLAYSFQTKSNLGVPGHRYSGSGATDFFEDWNSNWGRAEQRNSLTQLGNAVLLFEIFRSSFPASEGLPVGLLLAAVILADFMAKALSPQPESPADALGVDHDRNVPGGQLEFGDLAFERQHLKADGIFIRDAARLYARMFYDPAYYTDHYNRAYQRLGWVEQRFGRTARVVAAVGMTSLRVLGDLIVIHVGVRLFLIDAYIRAHIIFYRSVTGWIGRRLGGREMERRLTLPPSRWKF